MPKIITTPRLPRLRENVYISRAQLQQSKRAQTIVDETQVWAKKHIQEAQQQAETTHQQALKNGYRDGIIAAIQAFIEYFDEGHLLSKQLLEKLEGQVRGMLTASLKHPDLLLHLLEEWIHHQPPSDHSQVNLTFPRSTLLTREAIIDRIPTSQQHRIHIDYHDSERFIMKCGDVIAEFDPEKFLKQSQEKLLQKFSNLSETCYQLDETTLKNIQHYFEQHFEKQKNTHSNVENELTHSNSSLEGQGEGK